MVLMHMQCLFIKSIRLLDPLKQLVAQASSA